MSTTKIQPGGDLHLTVLMARHSLNFVTGTERAALLAYGRDVFTAGAEHAATAGPATPVQIQALYRARRALHAIGSTYNDSELRTRALEADEEIDRVLAAAPQAPAGLDELRQIAAIAACWGCDHPDEPGDTEVVRRVKWAARQLRAVSQAPAAPGTYSRSQHDADSRELRSLCIARDAARRERDLARVEIAGLQASTGHMSALVDGQHALLEKAKATMTALHGSASPIDESGGDFDARIPASAFARFVDAHAELLHAMAQSPVAAPAAPAVGATSDTALLDAMQRHRIALVPEFEGPWDAEIYNDHAEARTIASGNTPREALRAALAAQAKEGGTR